MTLSDIAGMLFGFPETFGLKPLSYRSDNDYCFHAKGVSLPLGEWIKSLDPEAGLFTVFLYPEEVIINEVKHPPHAEVWLTQHWKESTSYRILLRESVSTSHQTQQLGYDLTDAIKRRIPFVDYATLSAIRTLIETGKCNEPHNLQVIELLRLKDIVKEYESRKAHLSSPPQQDNSNVEGIRQAPAV